MNNPYAKMHAVVEWCPAPGGVVNWEGVHDLTVMTGNAVDILHDRGVFQQVRRGLVSPMVNKIVSSGTWDGVYHILYKEGLAGLLADQRQSRELYWVLSVQKVLATEEHSRGGAVRLVVVYVELAKL